MNKNKPMEKYVFIDIPPDFERALSRKYLQETGFIKNFWDPTSKKLKVFNTNTRLDWCKKKKPKQKKY